MKTDADAQQINHALQSHQSDNKGKIEPAFAVTLACDRAEAFALWQSGSMVSAAPNAQMELDVVFSGFKENESINFVSPENASTSFSGQFQFGDAVGGRGTTVTALIHVERSAGRLEKLFATWRGTDPALLLRRDMRRMKQLIETGEVATNARTLEAAANQEGME